MEKIKFGANELEIMLGALGRLSDSNELTAKVGWEIIDLSQKLEKELKIYQELHRKIFEKYGEQTVIEEGENKGQTAMKIKKENIEEATKEIAELNEKEIEVEINKIDRSNIEKIKISPRILFSLRYFFN